MAAIETLVAKGVRPVPQVPRFGAMALIGRDDIIKALPWRELIEALRTAFAAGATVPLRHHHTLANDGREPDGTLLLMPAWRGGGHLGIKIAHICPGNSSRGLPAVNALYLLSDAETGEHIALMDGGEITARRTAASSALAADMLARRDASRLLLVGTGRVARNSAEAFCAIRPIREIMVWGRNLAKASELARSAEQATGVPARPVTDLAEAVPDADIISCATLSTAPIVRGEWLSPGAHLDLIGAFTPDMRETDDIALKRSTIFVDTMEGAPKEAGELSIPLSRGVISRADLKADLFGLCRGEHPGRTGAGEITLFKSVGHAIEDLAAAECVAAKLLS
jgi:ornithine cyclodeaminase